MKTGLNNRIELTDNLMDIALGMAEGNPGAISVIMNLIKQNEAVDPDSAFGPYSSLLSLDSMGIYGSHIWVLFKDVCSQDTVWLIGLLRARQLGFISEKELIEAANYEGYRARVEIDVPGLVQKVCERLPNFAKPALTKALT